MIGFIGLGNMASAMIGGMLQKDMVTPGEIIGSCRTEETAKKNSRPFWNRNHHGSQYRGTGGRYPGTGCEAPVFPGGDCPDQG